MKVPNQFLLICIASFVIGNSVSACEVDDEYVFTALCSARILPDIERLDKILKERLLIRYEQMSPSQHETMQAFYRDDSKLAAYHQRIQSWINKSQDLSKGLFERVVSGDVRPNECDILMDLSFNVMSEVRAMNRFILTKADEILAGATTPYASTVVADSVSTGSGDATIIENKVVVGYSEFSNLTGGGGQ